MTQSQTPTTGDLSLDSSADAAAPLKKKEFIARVKQATEGGKPDLRSIVDATLNVLGEALAKGENVQMRALGRARVNRTRKAETSAATVLTVKLRRGTGVGKEALAVAGV
jgi:nucleoid DNA-binding protein